MTIHTVILEDENATQTLAKAISQLICQNDCIAINGTLGAGKTSFMRALINSLGYNGDVISPTFMLVQDYPVILSDNTASTIYHIDAYRIEDSNECEELGLPDMLDSGVVCIEWPDICADWLPNNALHITLDIDGNNRIAKLQWSNRNNDLQRSIETINDR